MAKVYNITDKMSDQKPVIKWAEKEFKVDDAFLNLLKLDELNLSTDEGIRELLKMALGEDHGIDIEAQSTSNVKILMTVIIAAIQGIDFDEAAERFQL